MSFNKVWKKAKIVPGWLNIHEAKLLYNIAKRVQGKGSVVEIGSYKGKSTVFIASGIKESEQKINFYAIDPHSGHSGSGYNQDHSQIVTFQDFKNNIKNCGVSKQVIPIVETSMNALSKVQETVEFIFIDGVHKYEFVLEDYRSWFPKVRIGGIMAFHDTTQLPGPRTIVKNYLFKSTDFRKVRFVKSITYGEKVAVNSIFERIENYFFLYVKNIYELYCNNFFLLKLKKNLRKMFKK